MNIYETEKIIINEIKSNYKVCYSCFNKKHGHDIARCYTFANVTTLLKIALKLRNYNLLKACSDFTYNKHKLNDKDYYLNLIKQMLMAIK